MDLIVSVIYTYVWERVLFNHFRYMLLIVYLYYFKIEFCIEFIYFIIIIIYVLKKYKIYLIILDYIIYIS
jgi:hypothetical protein